MKWPSVFVLLLLTLNPVFAQSRRIAPLGANGRRVALVIGNDNYQNVTKLSNAVNDARAMAQALRECGFEVKLVVDANFEQMGTSVNDFIGSLHRGDVALFYYSGHGMQVNGENYLAPVNLDVNNEAQVRYRSLNVSEVLEQMEGAGADLQIVILDACRNNPFAKGGRAIGGRGLAPITAGNGTFISYATAPGQTADDNSVGANGLFTQYLLQALSEPGLTLEGTFKRANGMVVDESHHKQVPWVASSVNGDFYFRPGKVSATQPPDVTAPPAPIRQSSCLPPPSGLVGWWPGDANEQDLVGHNNPYSIHAVGHSPGKVLSGFTFGNQGYIQIPAAANLANQRFTWVAWVRPDGPGPNNDDAGNKILGQFLDGSHASVGLFWRSKDERFFFQFGSSQESIASGHTFAPGQFYLVSATYDGATFRLLVNGQIEGFFSEAKPISYASSEWMIGSADPRSFPRFTRTWNGVIDEIQAYNRALSQSEIQSIFDAGSSGQCKPTGNSR